MNEIKFNPFSNRERFEESWSALEDGDEIDLTGATIVFCARDPETNAAVLNGSTETGEITISTTAFTLEFPESTMHALCAKEYKVGCTIDLDGEGPVQFFVGTLPIVDGVVP